MPLELKDRQDVKDAACLGNQDLMAHQANQERQDAQVHQVRPASQEDHHECASSSNHPHADHAHQDHLGRQDQVETKDHLDQ